MIGKLGAFENTAIDMEVRDKWVNECCNRVGIVEVVKCPTDKQVADLLTKTMTNVEKFEALRELLYRPMELKVMMEDMKIEQ